MPLGSLLLSCTVASPKLVDEFPVTKEDVTRADAVLGQSCGGGHCPKAANLKISQSSRWCNAMAAKDGEVAVEDVFLGSGEVGQETMRSDLVPLSLVDWARQKVVRGIISVACTTLTVRLSKSCAILVRGEPSME